MKRQYLIIIFIILVIIAFDRITKYLVLSNMMLGEQITVIDNFFTITSHRNTGAAWGILSGSMTLFYLITLFAGVMFVWLIKDGDLVKKPLYTLGITFMVGGAIGNFIDRLVFQEVVDFIDIDIFSYTTFPIFNVADSFLVIGVILFSIDIIFEDVVKWKGTK